MAVVGILARAGRGKLFGYRTEQLSRPLYGALNRREGHARLAGDVT